MPRGAKKHANPHNSRHENGVIAPGKRVAKQKSNGHLNGSLEGRSLSEQPPPSPSGAEHLNPLSDGSANGVGTETRYNSNGGLRAGDLERVSPEEASEESDSQQNGTVFTNGSLEQTHCKIDVNAARNPAVHDNSTVHLALTILRSCPLGDTLAILIFLLWLPPTFLTLVNFVFAIITFMAPTGSFSSFPNTFSDIFQGSGGTPSLATICLTDVLGVAFWLVMFTPVQTFALELAQAIVATRLGGGYSSKSGGSEHTLLCMFIVSATHIARHKHLPERVFGYGLPMEDNSSSRSPNDSMTTPQGYDIPSRSPVGWFRILISLHILTQGLVHVARRWYTHREYSHAISMAKKHDSEVVAGSQGSAEGPTSTDTTGHATGLSVPELASKMSIATLREARDKVSSGKKKRKQSTYVRSQQPLWAAFAALRVTILREFEQSRATNEAVGSNATDVKNLGSAPFMAEENRIWVTLVQLTSFKFDTSFFRGSHASTDEREELREDEEIGVDKSKPFYVRVNGANWTSTRIERVSDSEGRSDASGQQWTGEVFGLTPSCTYLCEFIGSEDDVVIHSACISTPSPPAAEQASSTITSPPYQPLRPSSPTTTLRTSILAMEASLSELQVRQRRSRKENKASAAMIKKEIDVLQSKIAKAGGEDKAQRSRQVQNNLLIRQADDAIASITSQLEELGGIPEEHIQEWKAKRRDWEEERSRQSTVREDFFRYKESANREISSTQAESSANQQKRERLLLRSSKLNAQLERIQSATAQGLDEKERKIAEQAAKESDRLQTEQSYNDQLNKLTRSILEIEYRSRQAWQQAQLMEHAYEHQQMLGAPTDVAEDGTLTPEGELPSTNTFPAASNPGSSGFRFPIFFDSMTDSPSANQTTVRCEGGRARSTSVLSGTSAYTDFSDPDPAPPMPTSQPRAMEYVFKNGERQQRGSGSSGSGSGSADGSFRDATSPVVASQMIPGGAMASPVWK